MVRQLHIAAYDVSQPARLRAALRATREYATGGQKSVHEVFLNDDEREALLAEMAEIIDPETDRFLLIRLDGRLPVRTLGVATVPRDCRYFLVA
jgi:CRISPR-associated protein Cas2